MRLHVFSLSEVFMKKPASFHALIALSLFVFLQSTEVCAQAFQGYTLYSPLNTRNTYLINMNNTIVHSWSHNRTGGYSAYLLEDGSLLRTAVSTGSSINGGGATGILQRVAWNGTLLWEYTYSSNTVRAHHDIEPMPNGNVLIIAWEVKTAAQTVQAGLNHSAALWPDHIIEVQPVGSNGGNIVWKWHFWDHLIQDYNSSKSNYGVVADHPELLDINVGSTANDWMHINAISYNPDLDQIVISSHYLDEIYVIDHSTTTQEAAGHTGGKSGKGGDILYRWGRPANYRAPGSAVFRVVHGANWIADGLPGAGNILVFNNRENQGNSIVMEINAPDSAYQYPILPGRAHGPAAATWSYTANGFYSNHLGGCQRLPNGNTLIAESTSGYLFEVSSNGSVVWSYQTTGQIPRALRYAANYPGLNMLVPAELTSFSASIDRNHIVLKWRTESELNNAGFELERSTDDKDASDKSWERIAFVQGHGTTTEAQSYEYHDQIADKLSSHPVVRYRLKQIDYDGKYDYSHEVELHLASPSELQVDVYPNPVTSPDASLNVWVTHPDNSIVSVMLYDMLGRVVADRYEPSAGRKLLPLPLSQIPQGVYQLVVTAGGKYKRQRVVITR